MSMVKYLFMSFMVLPSLSYGQKVDEMTVFNCESRSTSSSHPRGKFQKNDFLNFDGTTRTVVSREAISQVKQARLFLTHLDELCLSRLANNQSLYMDTLRARLKVNPQLIGSVYFPTAGAKANRQNLKNMRDAVAQYANEEHMLLIVGSADTTGEDSYNDWLSLKRAQYLAHAVAAKDFNTFIIPLGKQGATDDHNQSDPRFRRADLYLLSLEK
ncbi:hypothetical protein GWD52_19975 [Enterobacteriaceae bacterium 4M9]|nr:hypothetical protein [Enterobacteriaceae bacterium 4M9]